jgi:hypothetical protein
MSKANAVAQHLPYLRRYARALTGSQTSGDAYVAATLETLVRDPELLDAAYPPRVTGERPEPAFLVSKPYQPATVSALVSQALFFERNAVQRERRAS